MSGTFFFLTSKDFNYFIPMIVALGSALVNLYETLQFYKILPMGVVTKND